MADGGAQEERAQTGQEKIKAQWKRRMTVVGGLTALLASALVLPPLVNISRYQRRVSTLMTQSLGRPVHMSSVELRLLPLPGFVLHDLAVSEVPEFGAEPILSARTVIATVRLSSLWQGKLGINRVSVDEASLNVVRSATGRWNLDSLMVGAQPAPKSPSLSTPSAPAGAPELSIPSVLGASTHFPYLEATNSRVNLKNGVEKSPFSLVSADLSLWQDSPGKWRLRLRGQPVRTDMEISSADTGEVRMEASLQSAAQIREMPLQLQMEWRDAQLGQLSRLMLGSDAGWRGDVTADIDVRGTPESAQTQARLRATGVRRKEFSPETPVDFDANCSFRYQRSQYAFHGLACDTAIGGGRLHLKAELPGNVGKPEAMLEVQQVPLQAGLDLLRTIRSGFAPGISVQGTANGSLNYSGIPDILTVQPPRSTNHHASGKTPSESAKSVEAVPTFLKGTITVDGGLVKGGELKEPLVLPRMIWTPAFLRSVSRVSSGGRGPGFDPRFNPGLDPGLETKFTLALGDGKTSEPSDSKSSSETAASPANSITVRLGAAARSFAVALSGTAATAGLRDLAYAFGLRHLDAADGFAGGTADFELTASGPWIPSNNTDEVAQDAVNSGLNSAPVIATVAGPAKKSSPASSVSLAPEQLRGQELLAGSVELHHTEWKQPYLARPVAMAQATISFSNASLAFSSEFTYGSSKDAGKDLIRGSAVVNTATNCSAGGANKCEPEVQLHFGSLDAGAVQAALLGAPAEKSLLSPLIDRMRSSDRPKWPEVVVNVQADDLVLGTAHLQKPVMRMSLMAREVVLEAWQADFLGGSVKGTGRFAWPADKPEYSFEGSFADLNASPLGALTESKWTGGPVSGTGSIQLSGLTPADLVASASGNLRFDWPNGAILFPAKDAQNGRPEEMKFESWRGTVTIKGGRALVEENEMHAGRRNLRVAGVEPLGRPMKLTFEPADSKALAHTDRAASPSAVK